MLPGGDKHTAEYRRKAEECLERANRATGNEKALFLSLAETWAKMAQQANTLTPGSSPIATDDRSGNQQAGTADD